MRIPEQPEISQLQPQPEHAMGYRLGAAVLVGALALIPGATAAEAHGGGHQRPNCQEFVLPVSLDPGGPKTEQVDATYCKPARTGHHGRKHHGHPTADESIIVATPGATYPKHYYDWPQDPERYSFVRAAANAKDGLAVLTYTPVGRVTGESSHPASGELTLARNATVLRQVVDYAVSKGYDNIYSLGHSVGSGVALAEAATDERVDGLVLTGYTHRPRDPEFAAKNIYPANQDPNFEKYGLDNGYSTTRPERRGPAFYGPAARKSVIRYDERHKDVVPGVLVGGYAADQAEPAETSISQKTGKPVLYVVGEEDAIFCVTKGSPDCGDDAGMTAYEKQYSPPATDVTYVSIPHTGHDLTTATTAPYTEDVISRWIRLH